MTPFRAKLIHIEGTKSGQVDVVDFRPLPSQILSMGRDPSCVLAFDPYKDPRVSARHAEISLLDGKLFIRDLHSTNGTRVNGIKIFEKTQVNSGDEVELGRKGARFRLEIVGDGEIGSSGSNGRAAEAAVKAKDGDAKPAEKDKAKDKHKVDDGSGGGRKGEVDNKPNMKSAIIVIVVLLSMLVVGLVATVAFLFIQVEKLSPADAANNAIEANK